MIRPKIAWEPLRDAYEKGASPHQLAQQYSVSLSAVYRHIRADGWTPPPKRKSASRRAAPDKKTASPRLPAGKQMSAGSMLPQLHQAALRLQKTAAILLTAAENGDEVSIREVKDLASLLRELATLTVSLDESGPDLVRVVLEPPLDEWAM
ncbi:MAG: hypothetical protein J5482_05925 [Oscillospiraceae bacterium]|nr:hypothetical protein [Oscillospiraceae bacterium]